MAYAKIPVEFESVCRRVRGYKSFTSEGTGQGSTTKEDSYPPTSLAPINAHLFNNGIRDNEFGLSRPAIVYGEHIDDSGK